MRIVSQLKFITVILVAELLVNQQLIKSLDIANLSFQVDAMRRQCRHPDLARDPSLARLGTMFIRQFHGPSLNPK